MRRIINTVLMAVLLVLVVGLLLAIGAETDKPDPERRPRRMGIDLSREEIGEFIDIFRVWKIVNDLELDEEQLMGFLPRFGELRRLREEYYENRHEIVAELDKLLEANASEDKLKPIIDKFRDVEVNYYRKYGQLQDALESDLSVRQRAKFIVFQDRYRDDMRRLIRTLRELSD